MYEYRATVLTIYDGDTLTVDLDCGFGITLHKQQLRLLGINAPEMVKGEPAGLMARDYLRLQIPIGSTIYIRTIKDHTEKYGRYLAVVYRFESDMDIAAAQLRLHPDDTDRLWLSVNRKMVETGNAVEYWP